MTFRKVTPAALKVNVKKFWQVLLVPWHVWAPIWVHFAPWWAFFPVKNRFSHIFPVPGGLPFLTVILTVKLARLVQGGAGARTSRLRWQNLKHRLLITSVILNRNMVISIVFLQYKDTDYHWLSLHCLPYTFRCASQAVSPARFLLWFTMNY